MVQLCGKGDQAELCARERLELEVTASHVIQESWKVNILKTESPEQKRWKQVAGESKMK